MGRRFYFVGLAVGIKTHREKRGRPFAVRFPFIWVQRICQLWLLLLFCGFCGQWLHADEPTSPGWSQDLLDRLIAAPVVTDSGDSSGSRLKEGFVLRSYQLRNLHLGDPGAGTNVVDILRRMLPSESQVTEDRAANTVHVLTDRSAQDAVLELISAMDGGSEHTGLATAESIAVPEEVRKALETLAATQPDSQRLIKLIEDSSRRLETRMSDTVRLSEAEARSDLHRELIHFGMVGATILVVSGGVFWGFLRRSKNREDARRREQDRSLALLPAQGMELLTNAALEQQQRTKELQTLMESFSIAYQADRQRGTVVLEAVAQKHDEVSSTLAEVQRWRQEMSENAGRLFIDVNRAAIEQIIDQASRALANRAEEVGLRAENATRKMEETAGRLEVQHAKAEALASELERTQREVDSLFDKLRESQQHARQAEIEAEAQRKIAYEKAAALAKKEAALAGLSLLMQEPIADILDTVNQGEIPLAETVPFPNTTDADRADRSARMESAPQDDGHPADMMVAEGAAGNSATFGKATPLDADPSTPPSLPSGENFVCPTRPLSFRILPIP